MTKEIKFDSDYEALIFGAFIHDIGKFYQRTNILKSKEVVDDLYSPNNSYIHTSYTAKFLKENFNIKDKIINIAARHHNPDSNDILQKIVQIADHLSSSSERIENKNKKEYNIIRKKYQKTIFSEIKLKLDKKISEEKIYTNSEQELFRYDIKPLNINRDIFPKKVLINNDGTEYFENDKINIPDKYAMQWNLLLEELDKIDFSQEFKYWFPTFYHLIQKYTWCIPSAIYQSEADISLFNHSKSTAAIATVLYNTYKKENDKNIIDKVTDLKFTILGFEINGIQKFIYNLSHKEGYTKKIRGRSFLITLITEIVYNFVLDFLDLPITNLIYAGGGNFFILSYFLTEEKIIELRKLIDKAILKISEGDLTSIFTGATITYEDIKYFNSALDKIKQQLNREKLSSYKYILADIFKLDSNKFISESKICKSCNTHKVIDNTDICELCLISERLSDAYLKKDYKVLFKSKINDSVFHIEFNNNFSYSFKFFNEDTLRNPINAISLETGYYFKINNSDNFIMPFKHTSSGFTFLGNQVPTDEQNKIKTFEEIAGYRDKESYKKLAIFKGDIDNLGLIFSFKQQKDKNEVRKDYSQKMINSYKNNFDKKNDDKIEIKASMAKLLDLSYLLDLFFSGYVNTLIKNSDFNNKIYLVYSGGDDIVAIGHWEDILNFSKKFNKEFRNFTSLNPFFHISAGIHIFQPKSPIYDIINIVEAIETKAKDKNELKDKISIFGDIVWWEKKFYQEDKNYLETDIDLDDLFLFGEDLYNLLKNREISTNFVYSIYLLNKKYDLSDNEAKKEKNFSWIPYLSYMMSRNLNEKNNKIKELKNKLRTLKYMKYIKIPAQYALLKYRENKEEK